MVGMLCLFVGFGEGLSKELANHCNASVKIKLYNIMRSKLNYRKSILSIQSKKFGIRLLFSLG